jgi:hypothetical protein
LADRFALRAQYIAGWYEMDAEKLVSATRDDFIFDDPAEPAPVSRLGLQEYMWRWQKHAQFKNEWILQHQTREDKDGVLTDWLWWEVVGTKLCGAAVVKTSDAGVFLERIVYFKREHEA